MWVKDTECREWVEGGVNVGTTEGIGRMVVLIWTQTGME